MKCPSCGERMRRFGQDVEEFTVCKSCRVVQEPCPVCGSQLRFDFILGEPAVVCSGCGYPIDGPWDDDGPSERITETVKEVCPRCKALFLLTESDNTDRLPAAVVQWAWMMECAGLCQIACYSGTCDCGFERTAMIDQVDGIVKRDDGTTGYLGDGGQIVDVPPPRN